MHRVLARAFHAQGVRDVFCLMGDGNKHWLLDMAELPGVRLVHTRHEGAALAMADGYARARAGGPGGVGVCAVTYGPGVTQLCTSLMVATKHRTPIVVFAADVETWMRDSGGHLDVDERAILESSGALVREVRDPDRAAEVVRLAFHDARTLGRVVAVLASVDVQERLVADEEIPPPIPAAAARLAPDPEALAQALQVLRAAERPVVLAGRGAVDAGAREAVDALAHRLGAVLATTFLAKGWCDDHPRSVGLAGGFATAQARDVLGRADVVVAVGASLNDHTTDHGGLFPHARVVQIDVLPHALIRNRAPADVYVRADAASALDALVRGLEEGGGPAGTWPGLGTRALTEDPREVELRESPVDVEPGRLDPRHLLMALDRHLPDDALVVVGGGHFMAFATRFLTNPGGRRFEMVFDFMTTGQAVPEAVGAAVAAGDRLVVAVEGDASFLMHVQELETAARATIPLLVLVMNDAALGAEYHKLRSLGLDPSQALAEPPDLGRVAAALGGRGRRLTSLDQVPEIMSWFDPMRGPHVVDCAISRKVVGPV